MNGWVYNSHQDWQDGPVYYDDLAYYSAEPYNPGFVPAAQGFFPAPPGMEWYHVADEPAPAPAHGIYGPGAGYNYGGHGYGYGPNYNYNYAPNYDAGAAAPPPPPDPAMCLDPGYKLLIPKSRCKVRVCISPVAPWSGPARQHNFQWHDVPCKASISEVMAAFGCNNADAAKNIMYEIQACGDGRWSKSTVIKGDNKKLMEKCMADFGWDDKRDQRDPVFLYFTKD